MIFNFLDNFIGRGGSKLGINTSRAGQLTDGQIFKLRLLGSRLTSMYPFTFKIHGQYKCIEVIGTILKSLVLVQETLSPQYEQINQNIF